MGLREYKRKRDFSTTSEPKGGKPKPKTVRGASRFVVQKHDARRLHYDFRLQMEGVLKSWALPKGLPWAKGEKHLAVEVEDHPIDYEDFEGTIPEGQYGGGTVMVWDQKAKGEWTLVRIRGRDGEKNQWLILKTGADSKAPSKKAEDQSVKTGRTMKQIAEARDAEWETNREDKDASATSKFKARIRAALKKKEKGETGSTIRHDRSEPDGQRAARRTTSGNVSRRLGEPSLPNDALLDLPSAKPRFIEPMKAKLVEKPPTTGDWIYELKFDGFRAVAVKIGNSVSLYSRNEKKLDARFPEIVDTLQQIPAGECVIDGEIVAVDEEGRI